MVQTCNSDNYSLKFRGSEQHENVNSFLPGSHQDLWKHIINLIRCHKSQQFFKTKIHTSQGPSYWSWHITWANCSALNYLECSSNQNIKRADLCNVHDFCTHTLFQNLALHDILTEVLMRAGDIKCIQLNLVCLGDVLVTNLVCMASI